MHAWTSVSISMLCFEVHFTSAEISLIFSYVLTYQFTYKPHIPRISQISYGNRLYVSRQKKKSYFILIFSSQLLSRVKGKVGPLPVPLSNSVLLIAKPKINSTQESNPDKRQRKRRLSNSESLMDVVKSVCEKSRK